MNKLLFIFIILLLGLVLCHFLGGNFYTEGFTSDVRTITGVRGKPVTVTTYDTSSATPTLTTSNPYDNYNHFDKSSYPTKFYGPNGTTATVLNKDGTYSLVITDTTGKTTIYSVSAPSADTTITQTTFYGPNGATAKITKDNNGNYIINVTMPDGKTSIYTVTTTQGQTVPPPPPSQEDITSTKSTFSLGQGYSSLSSSGSTGYDYSSSLPKGIPKSLIPKGQEDLYILKSEVVPPVCPACPACYRGMSSGSSNSGLTPGSQGAATGNVSGNSASGSNATTSGGSFLDSFSNNYMESTKCPPCPPCARCPEPAFDCKKVPNYNSINNSYLPMPVLSDFSNFGM